MCFLDMGSGSKNYDDTLSFRNSRMVHMHAEALGLGDRETERQTERHRQTDRQTWGTHRQTDVGHETQTRYSLPTEPPI